MAHDTHGNHGASGGGAGHWVFWGFVLVVAYFLITEHRAHVVQYLPLFLLLACPFMHLFHGHGGHHHEQRKTGKADGKRKDPNREGGSSCH